MAHPSTTSPDRTSSAYPAAMTLIRDRSIALDRETPPVLLSALSMASLVTTAIGPILGGALVGVFGWQVVFAVNLPAAAVTIIAALLWLPSDARRPAAQNQTARRRVTEAVDFLGIALFSLTIASLLILLLELQSGLWWLGVITVGGAVALVVWERRREDPFIDVRLLTTNAALSRTYLRLLLTFTTLYLFVNAVSQWLQDPFGLSAFQTGLLQVPIAVVAGVASLCIARTTRMRVPLIVTAIGPIATGVVFAFIGVSSPLWLILASTALIGIPQGLGSLANQAVLYRQVPTEVELVMSSSVIRG
ncbi:MFS transporter [Streptomyces misionensis]|uniref:MFS transporter n=1 Tax=Streptomyces misionensis TaxID=67331 RepID=UPI0033EE3602